MSALEDLRTLQRKWDAEGWPPVSQPEDTGIGFEVLIGTVLTGCALALIPFIIITLGALL